MAPSRAAEGPAIDYDVRMTRRGVPRRIASRPTDDSSSARGTNNRRRPHGIAPDPPIGWLHVGRGSAGPVDRWSSSLSRVSDAPSSCSCARGSIHSPSRPSAPAGRKEQRLRSLSMGARAFIPVALAGAALLSLVPATPVAAASPRTEAQQIIRIAMQHRGAHWHYGAAGPRVVRLLGPRDLRVPPRRVIARPSPTSGRRGPSTTGTGRTTSPAGATRSRATWSSGAAARTSASTSATARRSAR